MIDYTNSKLLLDASKIPVGEVVWRSPSNLAILKYWGKHGIQLPNNPSLSMTLQNAYTDTVIKYSPKEDYASGIDLDFHFHAEPNEAFKAKIVSYFESLLPIFPFLEQLKLDIHSGNSFPHSSGIASSASSMSALALCLCTMEDQFFGTLEEDTAFDRKASYVARLGSGSASRSIFPGMALWGQTGEVEGSSDYYAVPLGDRMHEGFKNYHDDILIVQSGEKSVSSRAGHGLMDENPYAPTRYEQTKKTLHNLLAVIEKGDFEGFGKIAEAEAMTLHALMMTSNPPYLLMAPNTLAIIKKIREYRAETKQPLYFSLDAGPNVHLLYPEEIIHDVRLFIEEELLSFCEEGMMISDWIGEGPEEIDLEVEGS